MIVTYDATWIAPYDLQVNFRIGSRVSMNGRFGVVVGVSPSTISIQYADGSPSATSKEPIA